MTLRSIGAAVRGAVFVAGGGENVREPRLPTPPPKLPPIFASTSEGAKASKAASRATGRKCKEFRREDMDLTLVERARPALPAI
ncbi:hypothetical protein DSM21852_32700 [Methylocystis bryophila]|nr:hypothetical protein DSM21852_32700 [Methylocystis bryophila]